MRLLFSALLLAWCASAQVLPVPNTTFPAARAYINGDLVWLNINKAPFAHIHVIGDVTGLQTALNSKALITDLAAHTGNTSNPHSVTKAQVGLGSVENTALSTWAGSANVTALGTIASGTVPWARLSGVPSTFAPPNPSSTTLGGVQSAAAVSHQWLNSISTLGVPALSQPTPADVGLGNVQNTALSTWAGTSSITTVGTLAAGVVPWTLLSSVPSTFAPSAHVHPESDVTNLTTDLAAKAPLASPAFTGTPTAPAATITTLGVTTINSTNGTVLIQDSTLNNVLRMIRSTAWSDSADSLFLQVGKATDKMLLTAYIGGIFNRFGIAASTVQQGPTKLWTPPVSTNLYEWWSSTPALVAAVDVNGRFQTTLSTPASSSAVCTAGQMWADTGFVYVCTATNTIKRSALSTF